MYYLLEDNRIIDSEKYINSILNKGKNSEKNYEYLYEIRNGQSYYYGKIKKQSESVFDLIEKGDLLKIKQPKEALERYTFAEYDEKKENYVSYIKDYFPKKILAIYKLDANGNYIKVWEKKENEKED